MNSPAALVPASETKPQPTMGKGWKTSAPRYKVEVNDGKLWYINYINSINYRYYRDLL